MNLPFKILLLAMSTAAVSVFVFLIKRSHYSSGPNISHSEDSVSGSLGNEIFLEIDFSLHNHIAVEFLWATKRIEAPKLAPLWESLTPEYRYLLKRGVPESIPPLPQTMNSAQSLAWLTSCQEIVLRNLVADGFVYDPKATPKLFEDPRIPKILHAFKNLTEAEAHDLAKVILNQQAVWIEAGLASTRPLDFFNGYHLAQIAAFHGPLTGRERKRADDLDLTYPIAILLEAGQDLSIHEAMEELELAEPTRYLPGGFVLVEVPWAKGQDSPVLCGHGRMVDVGAAHPLATDPRMDFLGLKGSKLRVCDRAAPDDQYDGNPFFTRVTLDGGVSLYDPDTAIPKSILSDLVTEVSVLSRPIVSPFEGLNDAGELGAENRIGGAPSWDQYPADPMSPVDGKPMLFLARCEHPVGGNAYIFIDERNLIAAVVSQSD
jgi:hypothetical protein